MENQKYNKKIDIISATSIFTLNFILGMVLYVLYWNHIYKYDLLGNAPLDANILSYIFLAVKIILFIFAASLLSIVINRICQSFKIYDAEIDDLKIELIDSEEIGDDVNKAIKDSGGVGNML